MNQKKRSKLLGAGAVLLATLVTALTASGNVLAEEGGVRAGKIKSKGIVNYGGGSVVIDTGDLVYLAGEIDTLEQTYKSKTLEALNAIGTYIRGDGTATHRPEASAAQPLKPTFGALETAIRSSQSFEAAKADLSGDSYYKNKEGRLVKGSEGGGGADGVSQIALAPATADNLSAGTVAYIDGHMLLGTGADNQTYYNTVKEGAVYYSADGNFKPIMDELGTSPDQYTTANFKAQAPDSVTGMGRAASSSGSHSSDSASVTSSLVIDYDEDAGIVSAYFPEESHRSGIDDGHINNATAIIRQADCAGYFFSPSGVW